MERGAGDLYAERAERAGRPASVTFQVTDRCNYDCVHCYQEHIDKDELSFAEVCRILDEIAAAQVLFLTLMGGEFFMRRDADDILAHARRRGFAIKLFTTGHHIHDKRADLIARMRPIEVEMSLYSHRARGHEQITAAPGSWQRTVDAARRLIARKVPVKLKAPAMESNAADLGELAQLARDLGAHYLFDPKVTAIESGDQTPVALRMRADTLAAFYRNEAAGIAGELDEVYADFDPARPRRPLDYTACGAGSRGVSINPQGQVWPCNALPLPVGDLRQHSFEAIWSGSERLDEVRHLRWATIAECNVCPVREFCQRCHGMALVEQGKIAGPSLEACRHAVAVRDALRERGVIAATETELPPTWDRVDPDGQHHLHQGSGRRSPRLRVL